MGNISSCNKNADLTCLVTNVVSLSSRRVTLFGSISICANGVSKRLQRIKCHRHVVTSKNSIRAVFFFFLDFLRIIKKGEQTKKQSFFNRLGIIKHFPIVFFLMNIWYRDEIICKKIAHSWV